MLNFEVLTRDLCRHLGKLEIMPRFHTDNFWTLFTFYFCPDIMLQKERGFFIEWQAIQRWKMVKIRGGSRHGCKGHAPLSVCWSVIHLQCVTL